MEEQQHRAQWLQCPCLFGMAVLSLLLLALVLHPTKLSAAAHQPSGPEGPAESPRGPLRPLAPQIKTEIRKERSLSGPPGLPGLPGPYGLPGVPSFGPGSLPGPMGMVPCNPCINKCQVLTKDCRCIPHMGCLREEARRRKRIF